MENLYKTDYEMIWHILKHDCVDLFGKWHFFHGIELNWSKTENKTKVQFYKTHNHFVFVMAITAHRYHTGLVLVKMAVPDKPLFRQLLGTRIEDDKFINL